jgi:outer membrane protein assembly factor BamB
MVAMPSLSRTSRFVHTTVVGVCLVATALANDPVASPIAAQAAEPGRAGIESRAPADRDRSIAAAWAAEQGWFGLARHLWQGSDEQAASKDTGGTASLPNAPGFAERIARLDAAEQDALRWTAVRAAAAGERWSAALYEPRWHVHSADTVRPAPLTIAAGLVLWNSGREIHAVTIAAGRPAWQFTGQFTGQPSWQPTANARDTLLFPRGAAAAQTPAAQTPAAQTPAAQTPAAQTPAGQAVTVPSAVLATVGNRAYAMLQRGGGSLLACLDLSAGAEGRLAWVAEAAGLAETEGLEPFAGRASSAATLIFDGQPTADHELCLIVMRRDTPQADLSLAAFDARDGSLRWLRSVGSALARDGVDHARGHRQAGFAEDRILLATHAGSIHAFDRDGTPAWRTEIPSAADGPGPASAAMPPAAPPRLVRDRVLVLPQDSRGVVALEARSGGIVWQWMPEGDGSVAQLIGVAGDGVAGVGLVVATRSRTGTAGLVRLACDDGQPTARYSGGAGLCEAAGASVLTDRTIFWPVRPVPSGPRTATETHAPTAPTLVEILDAATLQPRRPPVECLPGNAIQDDIQDDIQLAAGHGCLVIATPGVTTCLQATPPQTP